VTIIADSLWLFGAFAVIAFVAGVAAKLVLGEMLVGRRGW
jgi:hypothetical protein